MVGKLNPHDDRFIQFDGADYAQVHLFGKARCPDEFGPVLLEEARPDARDDEEDGHRQAERRHGNRVRGPEKPPCDGSRGASRVHRPAYRVQDRARFLGFVSQVIQQ